MQGRAHWCQQLVGWLRPFRLSLLVSLLLLPLPLRGQSLPPSARMQPQSLGAIARALRAQRAQKHRSGVPYFTNDNIASTDPATSSFRRPKAPRKSTATAATHAPDQTGADRATAMQRALAHVQAREYNAALEIFRRLAETNPHDYEARVWVARLLSWQEHYARARELYHAVLRDDSGNLEAELGLVDILGWQGRLREARQLLATLQAQHPGNVEILLRRGKIARWQGRRREALAHYREALRLEPANGEALEAVQALRTETRYEVEAGYFLEDFDFAGNTNGNFVSLLYHDNHRTWLLGRVQYQNKFEQNNSRFTAGATYRFFASTYLRGEFSWAPTGDTVIPNQDYTVEVTQGLPAGWAVGGGYRFLNFRDAEVQVLTALVNWDARPNLHLFVRYTPARTDFDRPSTHVWNQGGWARLVWDAHPRISPFVLFGVGSESFAGVSVDQLGRFAAQTYAVGAEVRLSSSQGFRLTYRFQNRSRGNREQSFGLSYFFGF